MTRPEQFFVPKSKIRYPKSLVSFGTMIGKYKIVTLCGSTKFKDEFITEQKRLTLEGNIVISVGLFGHTGDEEVWLEKTKMMLDDMHKRKIDLADEIFVINPGGYIGASTRSEIEYAIKTNKPVGYLV
jgi:predicted phosphodiesterase